MVLESQVLSLNSPSPRTLAAFRKWFTSTAVPVLWDRDKDLFKNERDLVALAPVDSDRLNFFLEKVLWVSLQSKLSTLIGHGTMRAGYVNTSHRRNVSTSQRRVTSITSPKAHPASRSCSIGVAQRHTTHRCDCVLALDP